MGSSGQSVSMVLPHLAVLACCHATIRAWRREKPLTRPAPAGESAGSGTPSPPRERAKNQFPSSLRRGGPGAGAADCELLIVHLRLEFRYDLH
jgi:hypothetical protein